MNEWLKIESRKKNILLLLITESIDRSIDVADDDDDYYDYDDYNDDDYNYKQQMDAK